MRALWVIVVGCLSVGALLSCGSKKATKETVPQEPAACAAFKTVLCDSCGKASIACQAVKKRRGRDAQKCRQGTNFVRSYAKEGRLKSLCELLNKEHSNSGKGP